MLLNLKTEMARKKISGAEIGRKIGISRFGFSKKINEKTQFTRDEMFSIHKNFFPETDMKYLFASIDEGKH